MAQPTRELSRKTFSFEAANCHYYKLESVVKKGKASNGLQQFHCRAGQRYFQIEYSDNGGRPRASEHFIDMALNESGVKNTSRALKFSKEIVTRRLKNWPLLKTAVNQELLMLSLCCERGMSHGVGSAILAFLWLRYPT